MFKSPRKKTLPPAHSERVVPCTVVRLQKKKDGTLVQGCDVYIGPRIRNPHWHLDAGIWSNAYHIKGNPDKSSKMFISYVLSNKTLRESLPSLKGKRLGCFCRDMDMCHGQELANLVNEGARDRIPPFITCKGIYLFFKGEHCPLSNLHKSPLKTPDGKVFSCLEQLRGYTIATKLGETFIARKLERLDLTTKEVLSVTKNLFKSPHFKPEKFNQYDNINLVRRLLQMKLDQDTKFKAMIFDPSFTKLIFVEATYNTFWGCGADIENIVSKNPSEIDTRFFTGFNVLGWMLLELAHGRSFLKKLMYEKQKINGERMFYTGLRIVLTNSLACPWAKK